MSKHAVIYARVSTDKQADRGISLDLQIARCVEYAESRGLEILDTVIETESAKSIKGRPGLQRIMDLAKLRKIAHVLTYKLDRTFRNTTEGLQAVALLNKKEVQLHIVEKESVVRTDTADNEFMLTLEMGLATRERKVVSERTKAALSRKREKGEFCGGEAPYGYRNQGGSLGPELAEQKIIAKIRRLRKKGYSIRRVVRCLAEDGHLNRRGKRFTKTSVERIVKREAA
jgi:site-specific DNA recombinase